MLCLPEVSQCSCWVAREGRDPTMDESAACWAPQPSLSTSAVLLLSQVILHTHLHMVPACRYSKPAVAKLQLKPLLMQSPHILKTNDSPLSLSFLYSMYSLSFFLPLFPSLPLPLSLPRTLPHSLPPSQEKG